MLTEFRRGYSIKENVYILKTEIMVKQTKTEGVREMGERFQNSYAFYILYALCADGEDELKNKICALPYSHFFSLQGE